MFSHYVSFNLRSIRHNPNCTWTMYHIYISLCNLFCIQSSYIANSILYAFAILCLFEFGPTLLLNEAECAFSTWKLNLRSFRYQRPQTHIFLTTKTKDQWLHLSRKMKLQNLFPLSFDLATKQLLDLNNRSL